jgi:hypothetical protein
MEKDIFHAFLPFNMDTEKNINIILKEKEDVFGDVANIKAY